MKKIKSYFEFSRGEQRGILILITIIILISIAPKTIDLFIKKPKYWTYNFKLYNITDSIQKATSKKIIYSSNVIIDPNTASIDELKTITLTEVISKRIINYRNTGARFNKKTDLKKIYGINDSIYNIIKKNIKINSLPTKTIHTINNYKKKTIEKEQSFTNQQATIIELNSADSLTLLKIKGIGPAFAQRIIKYRELLGGFNKKKQLLEVYGIDNNNFSSISKQISIDNENITKLDLNSVTFKQLNKHPYISYNQTKSIFRYKKLMSKFNNIEDIINNNLMDSIEFKKAKPYLIVR